MGDRVQEPKSVSSSHTDPRGGLACCLRSSSAEGCQGWIAALSPLRVSILIEASSSPVEDEQANL